MSISNFSFDYTYTYPEDYVPPSFISLLNRVYYAARY